MIWHKSRNCVDLILQVVCRQVRPMDRSPPDSRKSPPGVNPTLTVARRIEVPEGPKRQATRPAPKAHLVEIARLVDPGDLVDRALAILADETEAWNVRRSGN